jgi:cobyrinic acid a,c-diamide synthase
LVTETHSFPRVVLGALAGDSGKTLVSLALALMARKAGVPVRGFKKGPDYIDAGWLTWACGHRARNLDTFLMGFPGAVSSFVRNASRHGLNVIEGNRGLYDGFDPEGTHSTAELAKAIQAPVLLVVDATKATRTVAACVLGCRKLDESVRIGGVILNRVSKGRHEQVIRSAIEADCGVPVLGAIPRFSDSGLLPSRHLGLVTTDEHPDCGVLRDRILELLSNHLDLEGILSLARQAPALTEEPGIARRIPVGDRVTVGYFKDSAFTFYYPENLEALEAAGATLAPVSSLIARELPDSLDALYIGGGFPETHAAEISANVALLASLKEKAGAGLPIYAECGGLMLLSRSIQIDGRSHPMSGVLGFNVEMHAKPQGHGYVELAVDRPNPFFPVGLQLKGHEFHYSRIVGEGGPPNTACAVRRGSGCYERRDAAIAGNVWAAYTHLHALGTPEWASGVVAAARAYARDRKIPASCSEDRL